MGAITLTWGAAPVPTVPHAAPSHVASELTCIPPAVLKSPPTRSKPWYAASARTGPLVLVVSGDQKLFCHLAIRAAAPLPPASKKSPPTYKAGPLESGRLARA